jgi:hypothetical protein
MSYHYKDQTKHVAGADPGFQVSVEGESKKFSPIGGRREKFWGISCEKSRFYAKKSFFFQIFLRLCPALIVQLDNRKCLKIDVLILNKNFKIPETMGNKGMKLCSPNHLSVLTFRL